MQIDRTTILSGPCIVEYDGQKFWSKGDVTVTPVIKRFGIETAAFGKLEERVSDRRITVAFEPAGRINAALAAIYWPYATTVTGASIYGATDKPLVIWGRDGIKLTVKNAALTKLPAIRRSVDKTAVGTMEFTGLIAKNAGTHLAASYWTAAAVAYPGDAGFDPSEILTAGAVAEWGQVAPWSSFPTEGGFEITFGLKLAEQMVDGCGTVDMRFQALDVTAKAVPVGPTAADALAAVTPDSFLGTQTQGEDLVITGAGAPMLIATLSKAVMTGAELKYGATPKRIGACTWAATRSFTPYNAGPPEVPFAVNPLFTITIGD